jgi:hypothetical protein
MRSGQAANTERIQRITYALHSCLLLAAETDAQISSISIGNTVRIDLPTG